VNIRRLMPAIVGVTILGMWAGAFLTLGRTGVGDASSERPGNPNAVKQKIEDLKASVIGKNDETQGKKVFAPQSRPSEQAWEYTPREVCMHGKANFPDEYKDVDCSDDKYSSPYNWREVPGMQR
jgi:hypothetical protein